MYGGGVISLGGGLHGVPIMMAGGQPAILSNLGGTSASGGGGGFSFVDSQPTSHATSNEGDPFSFVKIQ